MQGSSKRRYRIKRLVSVRELMLAIVSCTVVLPQSTVLKAQEPAFFAGVSTSWGQKAALICTLTCSKGSISSAKNRTAFTAGVTVTPWTFGPLAVETGVFYAPKGWSVTMPSLKADYIEISLLAHLGVWPNGPGVGVGVTGGVAADVDPGAFEHNDVAMIMGLRLSAAGSGPRFFLDLRYAKGFKTIYSLQNHVVTFLFGISP